MGLFDKFRKNAREEVIEEREKIKRYHGNEYTKKQIDEMTVRNYVNKNFVSKLKKVGCVAILITSVAAPYKLSDMVINPNEPVSVEKEVSNKGSATIINKDSLGNAVEGAVFEILDSNKEQVALLTTDEYGAAKSDELEQGKYYYKQIKVPDGIVADGMEWAFGIQDEDIMINVQSEIIKTKAEKLLEEKMKEINGFTKKEDIARFLAEEYVKVYNQENGTSYSASDVKFMASKSGKLFDIGDCFISGGEISDAIEEVLNKKQIEYEKIENERVYGFTHSGEYLEHVAKSTDGEFKPVNSGGLWARSKIELQQGENTMTKLGEIAEKGADFYYAYDDYDLGIGNETAIEDAKEEFKKAYENYVKGEYSKDNKETEMEIE